MSKRMHKEMYPVSVYVSDAGYVVIMSESAHGDADQQIILHPGQATLVADWILEAVAAAPESPSVPEAPATE